MQKITTFLMFEGKAEAAMRFYTSLFADSEIRSMTRYGPGEAGPEGTVQHASFVLAGQQLMCIDEIERLYAALGEGGQILMPLGSYDFSTKFGWGNDVFGVSWQLNLGELATA